MSKQRQAAGRNVKKSEAGAAAQQISKLSRKTRSDLGRESQVAFVV